MMAVKRVLFIASHRPDRAPGQRFRFEQYFSYLEENGYSCELSWLLNEEDDSIFYSKGNVLNKAAMLTKHHRKRMLDLRRIHEYDIVFIFREALMTRSLYFEKRISTSGARVIFDFDDAIWLNDTSDANRLFKWMKRPSKIADTIGLADLVFAGNSYLANYARQFNQNVVVVPTTIDTDQYINHRIQRNDQRILIGWSGSITTIKHFEYALPFLTVIRDRFGDKVAFKVIGDGSYRNSQLNIQGIPWRKQSEISDLSEIDIGIMPLPDDEWARGKCGLKGLQYMALSIPTIMSPVGVNRDIIQDGVNGFLASNLEQWVEKISLLITDRAIAAQIGRAARQTVLEKYSVNANRDLYLRQFSALCGQKNILK
jgi:glycosyltransferase involved in cell wall biosynthesis